MHISLGKIPRHTETLQNGICLLPLNYKYKECTFGDVSIYGTILTNLACSQDLSGKEKNYKEKNPTCGFLLGGLLWVKGREAQRLR